jgi:hypothetical protein
MLNECARSERFQESGVERRNSGRVLPDSEPQIISTRANGGGGLQYAVGDDTQDPRRFRRFPSSLVDIVEGHFD